MATTRQTAASTRIFPTRNDLPERARATAIAVCNRQLAAVFDLYSQTKQAHWNVKGREFIALHKLFDDLAEVVLAHVDLIAERATALGGYACGTARMAAAASALPEFPLEATDGMEHVAALVERFGVYAAGNREAIGTATEAGDQDTADLFTEVSRETDKALWFLEAHLQG
jgi:starvation-inducible DNA-binding protein